MATQAQVQIVDEMSTAAAMLSPLRLEILEELQQPNSATGLAKELGQPRQKLNYHLRQLEDAGLLELVETRMRRNCEERILRTAARSYLISPAIIGALGRSQVEVRDRFSSGYQVGVLANTLSDIAFLRKKAEQAGQRLATLTLQTTVRFASPQKRKEFAEELASFVAELSSRYHDDTAENGRSFSFVVAGYPTIDSPSLLRELEKGTRTENDER